MRWHRRRKIADIFQFKLIFRAIYAICFPSNMQMYLCFSFAESFQLPRPLRPTKRRSLNFATWFFITAVWLRSSPQKFSSLPAITVTRVPSFTSPNATTLNAPGSVLFDRQCVGNVVHTWKSKCKHQISRMKIVFSRAFFTVDSKLSQF